MFYVRGPIPGHWEWRRVRRKGSKAGRVTRHCLGHCFMKLKAAQPPAGRCLPIHMGRFSGYMMYGETTFQTRRKHRTLFICSGPSCYRVWLDKAFNPLQFWVAQVIIFNSCSGHQFLSPSVWPFIQVWNWWQNPEIQVCVFSAWMPGSSQGKR